MYLHNLNPVAVEFFNLKIYWYSLAYIFGFLFCLYYSKYLVRKRMLNLDINLVEDFITWSILAVLIGGRCGYIFFYNLEFYLINPVQMIQIWKGGMSFHGGLIGLIVLMFFYSSSKKIEFSELANLVAYTCPVGIFLGRTANFINGELIGRPTNGSWGVLYPPENIARYPSQIFEAFFEGIVLFIILNLFLRSNLKRKFQGFAVFLIFYSLFRFNLEFFREPDHHLGFILYNLSMGQILTIPMFVFGLIFLRYGKKFKN